MKSTRAESRGKELETNHLYQAFRDMVSEGRVLLGDRIITF
ncbi:MAG: hypothetical protein ACREPR_10905 [Brasilonema sp.]